MNKKFINPWPLNIISINVALDKCSFNLDNGSQVILNIKTWHFVGNAESVHPLFLRYIRNKLNALKNLAATADLRNFTLNNTFLLDHLPQYIAEGFILR